MTHIKVANVRAIPSVELRFRRGFNLIVGVNGAGKTSILDALAVCLSAIVKHANGLRTRVKTFGEDDIRVGARALDVECGFKYAERAFGYVVHKPLTTSVPREEMAGMPREEVYTTPKKTGFLGELPKTDLGEELDERPLAVLFSTNRAIPSMRKSRKGAAIGGVAAACADSLSDRELRLGEVAAWMRVRRALSKEDPEAADVLASIEYAVTRFLPDYKELRLDEEDGGSLLIDRGDVTLSVRQLSNGERGVLALVLDLTRRLALANPDMDDPALNAEAVVLIDELDLHLHPKWQRRIVDNLTAAFPRCQFIATTHSPQVIGEIEHERIQIISDGEVHSPIHSFGVDSSRVLEEIMDADPRNAKVQKLLAQISSEIDTRPFDQARTTLASLVEYLGENDPEVTRIRILLDFMEGEE